MNLYLVQHGDALPKEVDRGRPLSEAGSLDVRRMARFLGDAGLRVARIMHSGKKRAEQTAQLLATSLAPGVLPQKIAGIDPLDPTEPLARDIGNWNEDAMVVGHLPYMSKLVSRLIVEDEGKTVVACTPARRVVAPRKRAATRHGSATGSPPTSRRSTAVSGRLNRRY